MATPIYSSLIRVGSKSHIARFLPHLTLHLRAWSRGVPLLAAMGRRRDGPLYASQSICSFDSTNFGLFIVSFFCKSLPSPFFPWSHLLLLIILAQCNSYHVSARNITIFSTDYDINFAGNWTSIARKNLTVRATDEMNAQFAFVFNGKCINIFGKIRIHLQLCLNRECCLLCFSHHGERRNRRNWS